MWKNIKKKARCTKKLRKHADRRLQKGIINSPQNLGGNPEGGKRKSIYKN